MGLRKKILLISFLILAVVMSVLILYDMSQHFATARFSGYRIEIDKRINPVHQKNVDKLKELLTYVNIIKYTQISKLKRK